MQLIVKKRDFINIRSCSIFNSRFQIQIEGRIGTRSILISYTQVLIVLVLDSVVKKIKALSIFTNVIVLKLLKGTTQTNTPNRNPMAKYSEVHEYVITSVTKNS